MTEKATRLYPLPPREIPAQSIYEDLELPPSGWSHASRPYVIINMVSSLDGKTTVEGKASRLGSQTDRQTMRNLRAKADAVMIGASTLRAERLSLGLDAPDRGSQPLALLITGSGDLPLEENLIVGEGQDLLVIAPVGVAVPLPGGRGCTLPIPADDDGHIDLAEVLKILKAEHAMNLLLVEGGPTLNTSLISNDLVDELFLTLSPRLLGGTAEKSPAILDGPGLPSEGRVLELLTAHLSDDELFLRYCLQPPM